MKITVHCLVKNEDKWVWFAINSVLPFVDRIIVYDTGSTDKTVEVIKSINSNKIIFEQKGRVDGRGLVKLRQEQLDRTTTEWFLILDGDEVWKEEELKKLFKGAEENKDKIAFINKTRNSLGDVYHYQPDSAGNYKIGKYKGNLNIRLIKKVKNLSLVGEYPLEHYQDSNGPIQDQDKIEFADCWCLHTTFLKRSSEDNNKTSGSLGKNKVWEKGLFMKKSELPEVLLFLERPDVVKDPLIRRGLLYDVIATIIDPLLKIKRALK